MFYGTTDANKSTTRTLFVILLSYRIVSCQQPGVQVCFSIKFCTSNRSFRRMESSGICLLISFIRSISEKRRHMFARHGRSQLHNLQNLVMLSDHRNKNKINLLTVLLESEQVFRLTEQQLQLYTKGEVRTLLACWKGNSET